MKIEIYNCNNIGYGKVSLTKGCLSITYSINGTGKSTLAKTIHDRNAGTSEINELAPFKPIGNEDVTPSIIGYEEFQSIKVFNET